MRRGPVRATGVERTFDEGRLIVSKTDRKGIIRYVNALFLEVSAYREEDIVGQPHNVIRHPDMPRCVFRLLWDRLAAGREIFAYVVNLAGDGSHYWVLAHVTPTFDRGGAVTGYHSNRRAPGRPAVQRIEQLYADLSATERRHTRPADAIEASTGMLDAYLAQRGQDYDEFVWELAGAPAGTVR
ncbi:PAS domain-containing protein [Actinoplanes teichomyceticus]|uniref:PAS domain S-box-containing protein n=1 Tax=Actinoplanes teichomyceticus TaxID=1867 RepID=A0A561WMH5_ACTTI|nr:PAS domain-containing protein [Actinoplanes teichomyceticus]TWG25048.1 PAS domain S-box-containing protein [Actinoplanes teichomyceticus]GIF10118.1 transcriptional regulator [Actinoplanes teichomyceticus]